MPSDTVRITGQVRVLQTYVSTGSVASDQTFYPTGSEYTMSQTKGSSPKQPDGWRAPSAYSLVRNTWTRASGKALYIASGKHVLWEGDEYVGNYRSDLPTFPSSLQQQAEVDALSKLKDQSVNLAQAFAERDQLANLVGDTASRIARAYRNARKGNFRKAANELGASWRKSTRNWLELQYAWKPLLGDIHGSVKELQGTPPSSWLVTVKGAKRESIDLIRETTSYPSVPMQFEVRGFHGAFVRLDYHPSDAFMTHLTRLGLTNPLVLAWELLPYSFVVDWLWPVGDWLNVMDATVGFNFKGGSASRITKTSLSSRALNKMPPPGRLIFNKMEGGRGKSVRLTRTVYRSSPLPRPPSLKNPLSLGHMANGLSLLAEAFGRRR